MQIANHGLLTDERKNPRRADLRQPLHPRAAGRPGAGQLPPPGDGGLLLPGHAGAGAGAAAGRALARDGGRARPFRPLRRLRGVRPDLRRQRRHPWNGPVRDVLRGPPVRPPGPASSGRARHQPRGGGRRGRPALGPAAERCRADAVLPHRRRPRGDALVDPGVSMQRGDVPPRGADDAGPEPGGDRGGGGARHVLRRQPGERAGRGRLPRRPLVHALRQLRDLRRPPARQRC